MLYKLLTKKERDTETKKKITIDKEVASSLYEKSCKENYASAIYLRENREWKLLNAIHKEEFQEILIEEKV